MVPINRELKVVQEKVLFQKNLVKSKRPTVHSLQLCLIWKTFTLDHTVLIIPTFEDHSSDLLVRCNFLGQIEESTAREIFMELLITGAQFRNLKY